MKKIFRSLLFVPAGSTRMLDKIDILDSDAFILDLEDSVPSALKEEARRNIKKKLEQVKKDLKLNIFIRVNELCTDHFYNDVEETMCPEILGYVIPKVEKASNLKKALKFISDKESDKGIKKDKIKIILMIESPKGILELGKISYSDKRIISLSIGWEDFSREMDAFTNMTDNMLDFIRMTVLVYAKANNILAIDTVYKNFSDCQGLKSETLKVAKMSFNGKFAIHPNQIEIINNCFKPDEKEIRKMEIILKNYDKFNLQGAINIDGVMYDLQHLKWALRLKEYLSELK